MIVSSLFLMWQRVWTCSDLSPDFWTCYCPLRLRGRSPALGTVRQLGICVAHLLAPRAAQTASEALNQAQVWSLKGLPVARLSFWTLRRVGQVSFHKKTYCFEILFSYRLSKGTFTGVHQKLLDRVLCPMLLCLIFVCFIVVVFSRCVRKVC